MSRNLTAALESVPRKCGWGEFVTLTRAALMQVHAPIILLGVVARQAAADAAAAAVLEQVRVVRMRLRENTHADTNRSRVAPYPRCLISSPSLPRRVGSSLR